MGRNAESGSLEDAGAQSAGKLGKLGKAFGDLSFSQVVAAALAAMTSLLLSSTIGIAGSIIGAAVGSVVATVSTQLYKNALAASAEKLRDIPVIVQNVAGAPHADASHASTPQRGAHAQARTVPLSPADALRQGECGATSVGGDDVASANGLATGRLPEGGRAANAAASAAEGGGGLNRVDSGMTGFVSFADSHDATVVAHARADRARRQMAVRVLAVSVVASLVAVALVAIVVSVATAGNGLGAKPDPARWMPTASQRADDPTASSEGPSAATGKDEPQDEQKPSGDQGSQDGAASEPDDQGEQGSNDATGDASGSSGGDGSGDASGSGDSTGSGTGPSGSAGQPDGSGGSSSGAAGATGVLAPGSSASAGSSAGSGSSASASSGAAPSSDAPSDALRDLAGACGFGSIDPGRHAS